MNAPEEVTFYTDESRRRAVFSFTARQGLDVRAEHDVFDEYAGRSAGSRRSSAPACCARRGASPHRGWPPAGRSGAR
ncbi:MAG TPA: hypothetical protein VNO83_18910 [Pseudonocardia sp.]|nr:hypothetical protein [Pseudonocardia sp.]